MTGARTLSLWSTSRFNHYTHIAAITILYYDWLTTLPDEIALVWKRPFGASSCWFLLNRYLSVLSNVAVSVFQLADVRKTLCADAVMYHQVLLIAAQVIVCIILTIRTYALYDKSKRILALILGFQLGLFGVSVWAVATQPSINGELVAATGCMWDTPMSSSWRIAIAWEALFAIDCLLFTLTTMRTVRDARGLWGARTRDGRPNIFGVVLRDGAMYFAAMALANLSNLVTFYSAQPLLRGVLSTFASAVSVTLASRLILNLHSTPSAAREPRLGDTTAGSSTHPGPSPGIFTTRLEVAHEEWAGPGPTADVLSYEMGGPAVMEGAAVMRDGREPGPRDSDEEKDADGRLGRQRER